ncbi:helix-turn-helix domain-containing protein [Modestobacter italicus]|uniref:helix-turn-helix domain-containing protein n=1 Tax=Modestobacter italicus (strain DSM 44449 / CECT 9708 / BC 501) TaxID=2732864 RepID=UPI001C94DB47|nr:helix-turn-helix transcriptional regulator [Modestobacter italicus]
MAEQLEGDPVHTHLGTMLRRIRRTADLSQRELADALGVAASTVARAETGARDLPARALVRAAQLAGLRVGLVDADGREVPGMAASAVRDRVGRRFPAHLDVRHGDEHWWHGSERYSRPQPWYTFDRRRQARDEVRRLHGAPADHQRPGPGDDPLDRARARDLAAATRRAEQLAAYAAEQRRLGYPGTFVLACTCPAACDELLVAEEPLPGRQHAVPHVDDCACRCDIA